MMTDEEIDDLAADIKANGLIHPIVLDKDGNVLPGSRADFGNLIVKQIQKWAKVIKFSGAKVP
jgi:hypothetical protein